jgi:phage-related protein
MAVTENMLIELSVESKGATKNVEAVKNSLESLLSVGNKIEKNLTDIDPRLGKAFGGVNKSVSGVVSSFESMNNSAKKAGDFLNNFGSKLGGVGGGLIAINQALDLAGKAYSAIIDPINKVISAFKEKEQAAYDLSKTLKLINEENIGESIKKWESFADAVEKNSLVDGEYVLNLIAKGKAMRINDDLLEKMIVTATSLSNVTGDDLNASFQKLAATLKGEAGELAQYAPEVKLLTQYQIRQGEAIDILAKKYSDFSKKELVTLADKQKYQEILLGNLYEGIGELISKIFNLGDAYNWMISTLEKANKFISEFSEWIDSSSKHLEKLVPILMAVGTAILTYFGPTILAAIVALGTAISGVAAAFFAAAIPIALVAAKAAILALAIDLVVRNLSQIPTMINIVKQSWSYLMIQFEKGIVALKILFYDLSQSVAEAIPEKLLNMFGMSLDDLRKKAKKSIGDLAANYDDLNEKQSKTIDQIKQTADSIQFDTGAIGSVVEIVKGMGNEFNKSGYSADKFNDKLKNQSQAIKKQMEEAKKAAQTYRDTVIKLASDINKGFDSQIQRQLTIGDEFDKILAKQKQINTEIESVLQSNIDEKQAAAKYADLEKQKMQNLLDMEKLRLDTIEKVLEFKKQIQNEIRKTTGQEAEIIYQQADDQQKLLYKQLKGIERLGKLREDERKTLGETVKLVNQLSHYKYLEFIKNEIIKLEDEMIKLEEIGFSFFNEGEDGFDLMASSYENLTDKLEFFKSAQIGAYEEIAKAGGELSKYIATKESKESMKLLISLGEKISEINNKNTESAKTEYEKTSDSYDLQIKSLDVLVRRARYLNISNQVIEDTVQKYKEILELEKEAALAKQPSFEYQNIMKAGSEAANSLTTVFQQGTLGMMTAGINVASMIMDAIGKIIDFIPQFIDKISGLFDKLTNFGSVLLNSFKNLNRSLSDFIKNFIPNIMQAIPDIIETIVDHAAEELPKALESLLDQLPNVIDKFIDRIPDIVEKLVVSIIDNAPRMVWMFVQAFIKLIPKLMVAWMRVVGAVVNGIINGIVNGIKKLGDFLKGISIKGPDTKKIGDDLTKSWRAASKTLTNESSKIFAVMDLQAGATTGDIVDKIKDNIYDGAKKSVDYLTMWWHKLLKILQDVWNGIVGMWRGLWDFVKLLWDGMINTLKGVWQAVEALWAIVIEALTNLWNALESIWKVVIEALSSVWDTIVKTGSQLLEGLKGIWQHVLTTLQTLWDGLRGIWDGVIAALTTIIDIIKSVWDGLIKSFSSFWESLKDIGTKIWDGLVKGIKDNGNLFSGIGTKIWDGLKNGLSGIGKLLGDQLAKLDPSNLFKKMFNIEGASGQGTVEKTLSKMGPNIDVPFISFAKGGLVPGNALVGGDSKLNDRVLALLSPGEAIIPRSMMENQGIKSIVDGVLSGRLSPERYWGGSIKVGGTTIGISDKGVSIGDQTVIPSPVEVVKDILTPLGGLWDVVRKQAFDMVMKMFEANKFHSGGLVPSFALGGQVPAMLNPGEFVINRNATRGLGLGYLNSLNTGNQMMQPNITINIEIETTKPIDDTFFRNTLMPRIKEDIKRRTLNGEFVISSKGIRS